MLIQLHRVAGFSINIAESMAVDKKNESTMYGASTILGYPMPNPVLLSIGSFQQQFRTVLGDQFQAHPILKIHLTISSIVRSQNTQAAFESLWADLSREYDIFESIRICVRSAVDSDFGFEFCEVFVAQDGNVVLKVRNKTPKLNSLKTSLASLLSSKHEPNDFGFIVIGKIVTEKALDDSLIAECQRTLEQINQDGMDDFTLTSIKVVRYQQRNLINAEILAEF